MQANTTSSNQPSVEDIKALFANVAQAIPTAQDPIEAAAAIYVAARDTLYSTYEAQVLALSKNVRAKVTVEFDCETHYDDGGGAFTMTTIRVTSDNNQHEIQLDSEGEITDDFASREDEEEVLALAYSFGFDVPDAWLPQRESAEDREILAGPIADWLKEENGGLAALVRALQLIYNFGDLHYSRNGDSREDLVLRP